MFFISRFCKVAACITVCELFTARSLKWFLTNTSVRYFFTYADEPFVGASVGYFAFLGVLAGRSFTVIFLQAVVGYHLSLVDSEQNLLCRS